MSNDFTSDDLDGLAPEDKRSRRSQADRLVELAIAAQAVLFHADIDEPYGSVQVGEHIETWPVHSKGFRRWLSREFWGKYKKATGSQALQDALGVLSGLAVHNGTSIEVHTRVAELDGALYLDLADDQWQAVKITPTGWKIITDVPVRFIRTRGMLPLPEPKSGGSLDDLRPFLNVPDDDGAFALIKAFLVSMLRPNRPFAFLALIGEQGSAKTGTVTKLRLLVDPNKAPTRGLPRELRDLAIAAGNAWILAFDNVSHIPEWISDALCSLSTGSGFSTRELYSDSDEKIFAAQRPVILNGIGDMITRPDLLDRSIIIQLPIIPENKRRQEDDLNREFDKHRPRILGALLDAAALALKRHPTIKLTNLPRMADFAVWGVAAEPAHHKGDSLFLQAYLGNRAASDQVAIDECVIGPPILQLMKNQDRWQGVFGDLLNALNMITSATFQKSKEWPKSARAVSALLRRIAPNLRRIGIQARIGKHTEDGTSVTLERICKTSSASSAQSEAQKLNDLDPDDPSDDPDDVSTDSADDRQPPSATVSQDVAKPLKTGPTDDPDNPDDLLHNSSNGSNADADYRATLRRYQAIFEERAKEEGK
jgi:hypothetical protein